MRCVRQISPLKRWKEANCAYWKVSVGLKCVRTSRIEGSLKRSPLYTHVSKNVISVSEISAVNFIVGWKLFANSVKLFIPFPAEGFPIDE